MKANKSRPKLTLKEACILLGRRHDSKIHQQNLRDKVMSIFIESTSIPDKLLYARLKSHRPDSLGFNLALQFALSTDPPHTIRRKPRPQGYYPGMPLKRKRLSKIK